MDPLNIFVNQTHTRSRPATRSGSASGSNHSHHRRPRRRNQAFFNLGDYVDLDMDMSTENNHVFGFATASAGFPSREIESLLSIVSNSEAVWLSLMQGRDNILSPFQIPEDLLNPQNHQVKTKGLPKDSIEVLLAKYKLAVSPDQKSDDKNDTCNICFELFGEQSVRKLACQHIFHAECIDPWLSDHITCPNCRKFVISKEQVSKSYPNEHKYCQEILNEMDRISQQSLHQLRREEKSTPMEVDSFVTFTSLDVPPSRSSQTEAKEALRPAPAVAPRIIRPSPFVDRSQNDSRARQAIADQRLRYFAKIDKEKKTKN